MCILAGIGVSEITSKMFESIKGALSDSEEEQNSEIEPQPEESSKDLKTSKHKAPKKTKAAKNAKTVRSGSRVPFILALAMIIIISHSTFTYVCHSVHVASEAYSSPSVVLAG